MYLPFGTFSPDVNIALVSASRNCFPRELSETRTDRLLAQCKKRGMSLFVPEGDCSIIESKITLWKLFGRYRRQEACDAAVLFLGNFSPEIEDAFFVKQFDGPVAVMAAAEESAAGLASKRGDALCGMLSAMMAIKKRGLMKLFYPANPVVDAAEGAGAIERFLRVMKIVKGIRNATIGLFGPRPRDFETCNYNLASLASLGVEIEEFGFFDLANAAQRISIGEDLSEIMASMKADINAIPADDFVKRLAAYEKAVLGFRDEVANYPAWPPNAGRSRKRL